MTEILDVPPAEGVGELEPVAAVRCRGLRKSFGDKVAVDGIDLDVATGEIVGLLGPNGAGKTTAIRMLTTLIPADDGILQVFGRDVARHPMATRRSIGYVPQQLSADATLTGRENVSLFARLFDVPRRERRARVDESLEQMGVADAADRLVGTYSGGMIRRLEMAQALINRPRLLVLDEPTIGQAITMPLFFASNALYPVALMPGWVRAVSKVNPLTYEVNALRGLLLGVHTNILQDLGVLLLAVVLAVAAASAILPRLVR